MVDGEPLGFYHFSGFDSGDIKIMANKYAGSNRSVMSLIRWYDEKTDDKESPLAQKLPWAFASFSNGVDITNEHRAIYRLRRDLQEKFPDPFSVTTDQVSYYQWFKWRAAIEYPEIIGRRQTIEAPGPANAKRLLPYSKGVDWARIYLLLQLARRDRMQAYRLASKVWRIIKIEGLGGVTRRLARRN